MPECPACGQDLSEDRDGPCPRCGAEVGSDRPAPPPWLVESGPDGVPPARSASDLTVSDAAAASVRPPPLAGGDPGDRTDPLADWDTAVRPAPPSDATVEDWVVVAGSGIVGTIVGVAVTRRVGRALAVGLLAGAGAAASRRVWETPSPDDSWARAHPSRPDAVAPPPIDPSMV